VTAPTSPPDAESAQRWEREPITHPLWCDPGVCTAAYDGPWLGGEHVRFVHSFRPCAGGRLEAVLVSEVGLETSLPPSYVGLVKPFSDDFEVEGEDTEQNRLRQGDWTFLEPEEARMLGRFLSEAADLYDRLHTPVRDLPGDCP